MRRLLRARASRACATNSRAPPTSCARRGGTNRPPSSSTRRPPQTWAVSALHPSLPAALRPDGTLPAGFSACEHWLWPTQPLAAVPRLGGERVVLVGPAVVRTALDAEQRFPALTVEAEVVESLNAFQTAELLSRLCGRSVPVQQPTDIPTLARAA